MTDFDLSLLVFEWMLQLRSMACSFYTVVVFFFFSPHYIQACEMLHKHFHLMVQTLGLIGLVLSPLYPVHRLELGSCPGRLANRPWSQALHELRRELFSFCGLA